MLSSYSSTTQGALIDSDLGPLEGVRLMLQTEIGFHHLPNPGQDPDFTVTLLHKQIAYPSELVLVSW